MAPGAATRLLSLQLIAGMPLLVWAVPLMIQHRTWGLLTNVGLQVALQAAMTGWRAGPLVARGGVTSVAFVFSGAGILFGGGDPASGVLFLLTALVLGVVLLGTSGGVTLLAIDAVVLACHAWAPGPGSARPT